MIDGFHYISSIIKALMVALFLLIAAGLLVISLFGMREVAHADFAGLSDGTYTLQSLTSDTGMIEVDPDDIPGRIVVKGNQAWLVVAVYAPNKYDALWKGKRDDAPSNARLTSEVIIGSFVEMDDEYAEHGAKRGNSYTSSATGKTYKAIKFAIPLTESELSANGDGVLGGTMYIVVRRAKWSPSNQGKWMGSSNHYFTFSGPVRESDATDLPIPSDFVESIFDVAKELIVALPADPDAVTESHREAIEDATTAYGMLSDAERATLDSTIYKKEQSYGRWLESAQWGLQALQALDNSTSLVDGDYSDVVLSSSSMGKSTSERGRTWTVVGLTVSGGKATATISCRQTSAFRKMKIGGVSYDATVSEGVPSFTVPIALGKTIPFTVDSNDKSDSIAYQITCSVSDLTASAERVSAAALFATSIINQGVSNYTDETGKAVLAAADNLKAAAAKKDVTYAELAAATKSLTDAIAAVVVKSGNSSGNTNSSSSSGSKSGTSSGTKSGSTSTGLKNSNATSSSTSTSNTTSSTSGTGTSTTTSSGTGTSTTTSSGTGKTVTVPTVSSRSTTSSTTTSSSSKSSTSAQASKSSASASKSSASASKDAAKKDGASGAAASTATGDVGSGPDGTGGSSSDGSPSVTVTEVDLGGLKVAVDEYQLVKFIAGAALCAMLFGGMCVRAFLFARARG